MTIIQLFSTKNFVLFKIKDPFQIATILQTRYPRRFLKPRGILSSNCTIFRYTATFDICVSIQLQNSSFLQAKLTKESWEAYCMLCAWICNWIYRSRVYSLDSSPSSSSFFDYSIDPRFFIVSIREIYRICSELAKIFVMFLCLKWRTLPTVNIWTFLNYCRHVKFRWNNLVLR